MAARGGPSTALPAPFAYAPVLAVSLAVTGRLMRPALLPPAVRIAGPTKENRTKDAIAR